MDDDPIEPPGPKGLLLQIRVDDQIHGCQLHLTEEELLDVRTFAQVIHLAGAAIWQKIHGIGPNETVH